ncbi:unnamed protein product [Spirodela intermedia]|uniref:Uncharacterized protein n=1 Tax=Spirodela intermedia TaxID=51605 RepID=A0A811G4W3_SPIIN|nr:unnamed protein product [Spirodela intermedia]
MCEPAHPAARAHGGSATVR